MYLHWLTITMLCKKKKFFPVMKLLAPLVNLIKRQNHHLQGSELCCRGIPAFYMLAVKPNCVGIVFFCTGESVSVTINSNSSSNLFYPRANCQLGVSFDCHILRNDVNDCV